MINFKRFGIFSGVFVCATFVFHGFAEAQKYKTLADTADLNKEYGEVSLDISKLNTKLITEKNKTAEFQSKSSSTAKDAVSTGQDSKAQASIAADGNTTETKKAVNDAKKADKQANNAKDAISDENNNSKKIDKLNAEIAKKQQKLDELEIQRAAIMMQLKPVSTIGADSTAVPR